MLKQQIGKLNQNKIVPVSAQTKRARANNSNKNVNPEKKKPSANHGILRRTLRPDSLVLERLKKQQATNSTAIVEAFYILA
jgi:hypothetical protein